MPLNNLYHVACMCLYVVTASQDSSLLADYFKGRTRELAIGNITSFLGIPYALAPLGNRRFTRPVTYKLTEGEVINATELGPVCMQPNRLRHRHRKLQRLEMDEDCLTLNIYVPQINTSDHSLPVLIYIHPGDFISGGGAEIDGESLSMKTNSVVVSFNYRLGIFGFFTFNRTIPQNLGILDIFTALQWLNRNIHMFNGDPSDINVLVGRSMLTILQSSYLADDLFHTAISFDDGYFEPIRERLTYDMSVFNVLVRKCSNSTIAKCLKTVSADTLLELADNAIQDWKTIPFQPVIDDFVLRHYSENAPTQRSHVIDHLITSMAPVLPTYSLVTFWIRNCSVETFQAATSYILQTLGSEDPSLTLLLRTFFLPKWPYDKSSYCSSISNMFQTLYKVGTLKYANDVAKFSLTFFVTFVSDDGAGPGGTSMNGCVDDKGNTVRNCTSVLEEGTAEMIRTFLHHGFPEVSGLVWRPYTNWNKNHVQLFHNRFRSSDYKSWPFEREESLWSKLVSHFSSGHSMSSKIHKKDQMPPSTLSSKLGKMDWGMNEHQLEALLFSLILLCLFLTVVTATLLRMVCYVSGKPVIKSPPARVPRNRGSAQRELDFDPVCKCNGHPHTMAEHRREAYREEESIEIHSISR